MGKVFDAFLIAEAGFDVAALEADDSLMEWSDAKAVKGKQHRESSLEAAGVKYAEERGWMHKKIGTNAWPDHLFLTGAYSDAGPIATVVFVEFKSRGKPPRPNQAKRLRELRDRGFTALVCDSREQFVDLFGP